MGIHNSVEQSEHFQLIPMEVRVNRNKLKTHAVDTYRYECPTGLIIFLNEKLEKYN